MKSLVRIELNKEKIKSFIDLVILLFGIVLLLVSAISMYISFDVFYLIKNFCCFLSAVAIIYIMR